MAEHLLKYGILAILAAISGFFLLGFIVYSIIAATKFKNQPNRLWAGLFGVGINAFIFLLTFPTIRPIIVEAVEKVLFKFR